MPKLIILSSLLLFCFLLLLPSPTHAYSNLINYQGRAFNANNNFLVDGCYPISFKIGRFGDQVTAKTGIQSSYPQKPPNSSYTLTATGTNKAFYNTHPEKQCPEGEVYVENGLFNVILDLKKFNLSDSDVRSFLAGNGYFYGISVNFDGRGWSLFQPLVDDNFIYPNSINGSPQGNFALYSHVIRNTDGSVNRKDSWGLYTNHGFLAQGGLGAPIMWDSDNTNYSVNPTEGTDLHTLKVKGSGFNSTHRQATIYLGDNHKFFSSQLGRANNLKIK